jgi:hypothetical protein
MLTWFKRLFGLDKPENPTHVVVIEPSPFRVDETYILGPYTFAKAKRVARRELEHNPYGLAQVWSRHGTIMRGNQVVRQGDPANSPVTKVVNTNVEYWEHRP